MRIVFSFIFLIASFAIQSQTEYEILLFDADVNEFDVFGEESYEKKNRILQDVTEKLNPEVGSSTKAEPVGSDNFEPKNLLDGNMKTCWMTTGSGKNDAFEIVIDIEETPGLNTATIGNIYFFNGWRKDYHTWKEYSRVKKITLTISDVPYAEIKFEDTYKQQSIDLDKLKIDKSRRCRLKFRISETYPGTKYDKVAISDVQLIGRVK